MRHSCDVSSGTDAISPYRPTRRFASFPLMVVEMKRSLPHTTGLESPRPGIAVFQATFAPVDAFHVAGMEKPSAIPLAAMPRNCGQSTPGRAPVAARGSVNAATISRTIDTQVRRMGTSRGKMRDPTPRGAHGRAVCDGLLQRHTAGGRRAVAADRTERGARLPDRSRRVDQEVAMAGRHRDRVGPRVESGGDAGRSITCRARDTRAGHRERKAALDRARRLREVGTQEGGSAGGAATQDVERLRVLTARAARRKGALRAADRAQRADRPGFVARNARAHQSGDRDRRDDADDRDDDQQLDEREAFICTDLHYCLDSGYETDTRRYSNVSASRACAVGTRKCCVVSKLRARVWAARVTNFVAA